MTPPPESPGLLPCRECGEPRGCHLATCSQLTPTSYKVRGDLLVPAVAERAKPIGREPSEAMLIAAREWSRVKYGKPIGNDAATGCWRAMWDAAPSPEGIGPSDRDRDVAGRIPAESASDCLVPDAGRSHAECLASWLASTHCKSFTGASCDDTRPCTCVMDAKIVRELRARDADRADAERWDAFCTLWAASTELTATQDEDGHWSITVVEAVEQIPSPGRWTGDDPDAAIDTARRT